MRITYPALFYYDEVSYYVYFPDFGGAGTQGDSISDAMGMAEDWLGITAADIVQNGVKLPLPTQINKLSLTADSPFKEDPNGDIEFDQEQSFISMVTIEIDNYLTSDKLLKKTLTIPEWADVLGKKMNLNFSQTLVSAIAEKSMDEY